MRQRTFVTGVFILAGVIGAGVALSRQAAGPQGAAAHPLVTVAEYQRWQKDLSNWGRWGKDDELERSTWSLQPSVSRPRRL